MKRTALALTLILALLVSLMVGVQSAESSSKTIVVPDDFPTIKLAIDSATVGDSIYVRNGIYSENVVIDKPLSIIGENSAQTIINGTESIVTINAPNVVISGFTIGTPRMLQESSKGEIRYYGARGQYGVYVNSVSNSNVTNNRIVNTRYGIYLSSASETNMINNLIVDVEIGINLHTSADSVVSENQIARSTRAIILQRSSYNQILKNTLINQTDGIVLYGRQDANDGHSTYNLIRANDILNSQDYGIRLDDSLNNSVLGNRVWSSYSTGIALTGASYNLVVSNLIYNFAPSSSYWGMFILDSYDNYISANYIINKDSPFNGGISANNISNTQIIGNKIENTQEGININALSSANNTVYANQIENTTNPYIISDENGFQYYQDFSLNPYNMSIPQTDSIPQLSNMPDIEIPNVEIPIGTTTSPPKSPPSPDQESKQTEPFPTLLVVAVTITVVAVVAVGLLVYFKKRRH